MSVMQRLLAPLARRAQPMPMQASEWDAVLGVRSAAGVNVTPSESLSISTVQACVSLISGALASVPLVLYRKESDGGRTPAVEHPLYRILHDLSNPVQTAFEVRQMLFVSVLLYGNGYAEIEWGPDGYPAALWPLPPDQVQLYVSADRQLMYRVSGDTFGIDGRVRWVPFWRMHHLRGLTTQGLLGLSPLRAANAIGLAMATEEFGARFFAQGARPGFILSHPGTLSDKAYQRLKGAWDAGGGENAHKTKIVEEGMKVEKIGVTPDESQFLETRAFQVAEICRIFNVSPGLVGAQETQTYASAEQDLIRFRELTLKRWAEAHCAALWRDCLTESEQGDYLVDYVLSDLQMTDLKTRFEAHQIGLMNGFVTQNEVRISENMNPLPGADVLWRPLNMGITGEDDPEDSDAPGQPDASGDMSDDNDADEQAEEDSPDSEDDNPARALVDAWVADVRERLIGRIANDVRQAGMKALRNGGRAGLSEWGETMQVDWRHAGESMLAKVPGVVDADVAGWVVDAYQSAVKELIHE